MVTKRHHRFFRLLGLMLPLGTSCTGQLDEWTLQTSKPVTNEGHELEGEDTTSHTGATTAVPSNLGGTEGTSSEPETVAPCSGGLRDNEGFCVPEVHCAPGTFITQMNGSPTCAPCASGSFSVDYDADECSAWKDCQLGEFVLEAGTSGSDRTCEVCPEGESTTVMNAGECSSQNDCPAGTFVQGTDCIPCSAGSYCSGKMDQELACESGTWDDDHDPGTPCIVTTSCVAGQFVQGEGTPTQDRSCEFCPNETFSVESNAGACEAWAVCSQGTRVDVQGTAASDRSCTTCEAGSFTASDNAASCTTWTTCAAPAEYAQSEPSTTADRVCGECLDGQSTSQDNAEACAEAPVANLVTNGDFETGTQGWITWEGAVLSRSDTKAHTGSYSLLVAGPGTGPAAFVLDASARAGATYEASFWVSVGKVESSQVNITRTLMCGGATTYLWLADNSAVPTASWVNLAGTFTIPADCATPKLTVYAEGSGSNVDLFVDNVSITLVE